MGTIENLQNKVPCLMSRKTSFIIMTTLLGGFFLIEVVVGYVTNSMALIADSFHMLSDVASLIVGYLALKYSTQAVSRDIYTYGYARAEVLGALVNAVFLVALCFSIFIESMKRLIILEGIENAWLVFFVGLAGLIINIFGMFLFHQTGHGHSHGGMSHSHSHGGGGDHGHSHGGKEGHGHSHGGKEGHGHSHGGEEGHGHSHAGKEDHGHSHGGKEDHGHYHGGKEDPGHSHEGKEDDGHSHGGKGDQGHSHGDDDANGHSHGSDSDRHGHTHGGKTQGGNPFLELSRDEEDKHGGEGEQCFYEMDNKDEKTALLATDYAAKSKNTHVTVAEDGESKKVPPTSGKSAGHLNIEGVYLHILGDALGSIIVMISAMFLIYGRGTWTLYVDPSMSIIMVIIILKTSIPLLMETSTILMNSAPQHIQINDLRERLLKTLPEIKNIHELHVWQLAGDKIIASVHVKFESTSDYDETAEKIKEFLHGEGIHSTTVQIEFERNDDVTRRGQCMVVCSLDSACDEMMCCKPDEE